MTTDDTDDAVFDRGLAALNRLTILLAEETRLIAAGRINEGLALAAEKGEHAHMLALALRGLRLASASGSENGAFESLRQQIEAMQETLAVNLAVLATARSVAEGILRDVSRRMSQPLAPSYGPGSVMRGTSGAPLLISRAT